VPNIFTSNVVSFKRYCPELRTPTGRVLLGLGCYCRIRLAFCCIVLSAARQLVRLYVNLWSPPFSVTINSIFLFFFVAVLFFFVVDFETTEGSGLAVRVFQEAVTATSAGRHDVSTPPSRTQNTTAIPTTISWRRRYIIRLWRPLGRRGMYKKASRARMLRPTRDLWMNRTRQVYDLWMNERSHRLDRINCAQKCPAAARNSPSKRNYPLRWNLSTVW